MRFGISILVGMVGLSACTINNTNTAGDSGSSNHPQPNQPDSSINRDADGSSSSGAITVHGTLNGSAPPTTDITALTGPLVDNFGNTYYEILIFAANMPGVCDEIRRNNSPANSSVLSLWASSDSQVLPGTYPVNVPPGQNINMVNYAVEDATCKQVVGLTASSGTITLTTIGDTLIQGNFDVIMSSGDELTGTFSAPVCNTNFNDWVQSTTRTCGQ